MNGNKVVYGVIMTLVLLVPASVLATPANFKVFVASDTIHELQLKATQMANGQVVPVSNFDINPESVVQLNKGKNMMVFTSTNEPDRIEKVKVTNTQGQITQLSPVQNNQFALNNLNVGTYVLNVIVDTDKSKNAYETVLVILAPGEKPLSPEQYITKVKSILEIEIKTEFVFNEDNCSNQQGSAKMGYPFQRVSECEVEQRDECEKSGDDSDYCEGKKERFSDDCDGFKNQKECDEYWENRGEEPPYECTGLDSIGHPVVCPDEEEEAGSEETDGDDQQFSGDESFPDNNNEQDDKQNDEEEQQDNNDEVDGESEDSANDEGADYSPPEEDSEAN